MASTPVTTNLPVKPARKGSTAAGRRLSLGRQLLLQFFCLLVAAAVLFPVMWIVSMSLDPRNLQRPSELTLIPPGASLSAYAAVMDKPTSNPVTFTQLALNSFKLAGGVAVFSVLIGVSAAYAFARFRFRGRQSLMLSVLIVTMLPATATLAPLFVLLNQIRINSQLLNIISLIVGVLALAGAALVVAPRLRYGDTSTMTLGIAFGGLVLGGFLIFNGFSAASDQPFILRNSLIGVGLAMTSTALPFAIWNLKGYLDTIPRELEEAAIIDGASPNQTFLLIILPLATPALAVTGFLGFMTGWTEFLLSWQFLNDPKDFTLAMSLWNMTGQYAGSVPWSRFAAMSILVSLPVSLVYLGLQRYIVGGLTLGGVKG